VIAGRPVVLLAGYDLAPEVRAELEIAGALVIDVAQRDPSLVLRHVRHALLNPMPLPTGRSAFPLSTKAAGSASNQPNAMPIICGGCGAPAEVVSGRGPHAARASCTCGAWRWISRRELQRAGVDATALNTAHRAHLNLGAKE
jgi:hypothetical protein